MCCAEYVPFRCFTISYLFKSYFQFLEGFFQHGPHCKDFITLSDGLTYIGRLTALPCLPYDFSNSVTSDSLVQVMRTLVDFATNETLVYLSKIVHDSLRDTTDFWNSLEPSSKLLPLLDINGVYHFDCLCRYILNYRFFRYQLGSMQRSVPKSCYFAHQDLPPLGCFWHCWIFSWSWCHNFTSNSHDFLWWANHPGTRCPASSHDMGKYGIKRCPDEERNPANKSRSISLQWNTECIHHQSY